MTLRVRLAAAAVLAMLPVMAALFWYDAVTQQRAAQQILVEYTYSRMASARQDCESAPETWGGVLSPEHGHGPHEPHEPPPGPPPEVPPGDRPPPHHPQKPPPDGPREHQAPPGRPPAARPAELFAYTADLRSQNPSAPEIPAQLARGLASRDTAVLSPYWPSSSVEALVRMPWGTGPCALVLARGTTDPAWGGILPRKPFWMLPVLFVLAAVLLAIGPVVGRIRRLTERVRRSAESAYAGPIAIDGTDEIAELSRAFDTAGKEIRAQLAEKDRREQALRDFVANTTHDVMVPLTVLQGHLSTLREQAARAGAKETETLVSAMNEAHYMASLVHNLTAAARLASADVKLQPSEVELGALVERVTGRHRPIARQLEVALESAIPAETMAIRADLTLLEQAISNVVYNAVRHNRPGGHVAVILERGEPGGFSIRVIDDGPGIPEEELSRLVERGYRGNEARTRAPDGQGLGLHIAFRAAELHGFSLALKPSEYGGLEVTLSSA